MTRFYNKVFAIIVLVFSFLFFSSAFADIGAHWAKSVTAGSNSSGFSSMAVDSSGNIYAAGNICGVGTYDFGNGVTVTGTYSTNANIVLVKYDSNGNAQWAKSVTVGSNVSAFNSITVDSSGNIYAVGFITGTGTYDFGNSVTVAGASAGNNIVLVKYDSNGNAQWAKSTTAGSYMSIFNSVAVDASGNIYAAGYRRGDDAHGFGNGVVLGAVTQGYTTLLVKYDSSGNAQWAKGANGGIYGSSMFYSVALDLSGNIYAVGNISQNRTYGFGNGVSITSLWDYGDNAVIVKYDSNGNAQWAKTTSPAPNQSQFQLVAVDSNGDIYVIGNVGCCGTFGFGNGVTASYTGNDNILVKYDSNGNAQWVKSVITGTNYSVFKSLALDADNNIYACGYITGTITYNFGNGVTVNGAYSGSGNGKNVVLVKYDSSGNAQWAKSTVTGSNNSVFNSLALDSNDNIFVGGSITGSSTFGFGESITVAGTYASGANPVIVKYGYIAPTLTSTTTLTPTITATLTTTETLTTTPSETSTLTLTSTLTTTPIETLTSTPTTTLTPTLTSKDKEPSSFSWIEATAGGVAGALGIAAVNYLLYKNDLLCYKNGCKHKDVTKAAAVELDTSETHMEEGAPPPSTLSVEPGATPQVRDKL